MYTDRQLKREERVFYLLHRPNDSDKAHPRMARIIAESGGVGANRKYKKKGEPGKVHPSIKEFARYTLTKTERRRVMPSNLVSSFNWFYLNFKAERDGIVAIKDMASEDELVYEVPESWVKQHALQCVMMLEWAFLTTEVVPSEFRILKPPKTERTIIKNAELKSILESAHELVQPGIHNPDTYL